jgi:hypothetical protein
MLRSRLMVASLAGLAATVGLGGVAAYLAIQLGTSLPVMVILWPVWGLQAALPCFNMGTPERPLCEGTPIHIVAAALSLTLTIMFYAVLAYALLGFAGGRGNRSLQADA